MMDAVFPFLVFLIVVAILGYLILFVLGKMGFTVPPVIVQLFGALLVVLIVWFVLGLLGFVAPPPIP